MPAHVEADLKHSAIRGGDSGRTLVAACELPNAGVRFQPRVVGPMVLFGVILREPTVFLALSALLWWCALLPRLNPFEALYNATLARRAGARRVESALAPRRFSQGMGATFSLAIALTMLLGWSVATIALEAMFLVATAAAAFAGYCVGCFAFHLLLGRTAIPR